MKSSFTLSTAAPEAGRKRGDVGNPRPCAILFARRLYRYAVPEISYHKGCKFTMKKIYLDISGWYFA